MADLTEDVPLEELHCFNVSSLEAVPSQLGQLTLISLYSLTALVALLGNLTVIAVALVGSESARTIRLNLINLAISDIILSVLCVPFSYTDYMLGRWIFPHWLCPTAQYAQLLSVFVTSMTLTVIGIERYIATLHPFSSLHRWLCSHARLLLIFIWFLGSLYAAIIIPHTATQQFEFAGHHYHECVYHIAFAPLKRTLFMLSNFVLTFLLPLLVLLFSYSSIMRKLQEDAAATATSNEPPGPGEKSILRKSTPANHRSKTIKMLFTVILLYGLCWAPIKVFQFLLDQGILSYCSEWSLTVMVAAYFSCHWLAMSNACCNPICYSFMSKSFRNDFRKITQTFRDSITRKSHQFSVKTASTNV